MFDLDYSTFRLINAILMFVVSVEVIVLSSVLLKHGVGERHAWVRQIPGRIVMGTAILSVALIILEESSWKLIYHGGRAGAVGVKVNDWNTIILLVISASLLAFAIYRMLRNTLGSQDFVRADERVAEATERLAAATEAIAERTTNDH